MPSLGAAGCCAPATTWPVRTGHPLTRAWDGGAGRGAPGAQRETSMSATQKQKKGRGGEDRRRVARGGGPPRGRCPGPRRRRRPGRRATRRRRPPLRNSATARAAQCSRAAAGQLGPREERPKVDSWLAHAEAGADRSEVDGRGRQREGRAPDRGGPPDALRGGVASRRPRHHHALATDPSGRVGDQ